MNDKDSKLLWEAYQEDHTEIITAHMGKVWAAYQAIAHLGEPMKDKNLAEIYKQSVRPFLRVDATQSMHPEAKTIPVITLYTFIDGTLMSFGPSTEEVSTPISWKRFDKVSPEQARDIVIDALKSPPPSRGGSVDTMRTRSEEHTL